MSYHAKLAIGLILIAGVCGFCWMIIKTGVEARRADAAAKAVVYAGDWSDETAGQNLIMTAMPAAIAVENVAVYNNMRRDKMDCVHDEPNGDDGQGSCFKDVHVSLIVPQNGCSLPAKSAAAEVMRSTDGKYVLLGILGGTALATAPAAGEACSKGSALVVPADYFTSGRLVGDDPAEQAAATLVARTLLIEADKARGN